MDLPGLPGRLDGLGLAQAHPFEFLVEISEELVLVYLEVRIHVPFGAGNNIQTFPAFGFGSHFIHLPALFFCLGLYSYARMMFSSFV